MADANITVEVSTKDAQKRLLYLHRENARLRRRIMADAVVSDAAAASVAKLAQSLVEAKADAERLRTALERLRDWGGLPGGDHYSGTVAADVMRWVRSGMSGPLPPMPEWAAEKGPNARLTAPDTAQRSDDE